MLCQKAMRASASSITTRIKTHKKINFKELVVVCECIIHYNKD